MERVAVFCGSSLGNNPTYKEKAIELGLELSRRKIGVVYGGGNKGLMGIIAHTVFENGGEVIGVLPKNMNIPSVTKDAVQTKLIITENIHERKKTMYSLSDGFIAMPGGIGTFEEILEIFTWKQLKLHESNVSLYNPLGFWDNLLKELKVAVKEGFLNQAVLDTLIVEEDPSILLDKLSIKTKELPSKL